MSDKPIHKGTSNGNEKAQSRTSNNDNNNNNNNNNLCNASPIPGITLDLAALFIRAIQTRRKLLSKTAASTSTTDDTRFQTLRDNVNDATQSFLHQLRRHVQNQTTVAKSKRGPSSSSSSSSSYLLSSSNRGGSNDKHPISNAATHCTQFLLETLANEDNSFHLRRASLSLLKEIVTRSCDARAHLSKGSILMDYIATVRRVHAIQRQEDPTSRDHVVCAMARNMFRHEAAELVQFLADEFGKFYPKFLVASRSMDEISIGEMPLSSSSSMSANDVANSNVKALRIERDEALKRGCKACQVLEGMMDRADEYFRLLVPRFGGFMHRQESHRLENVHQTECGIVDRGTTNEIYRGNGVGAIEEDDGGDSIDWEEGDTNFYDPHNNEENDNLHCEDHKDDNHSPHGTPSNPSSLKSATTTPPLTRDHADHDTAVTQTLAVMEKSGALHEGGLAIQLGSSAHNVLATDDNVQAVHEKLKGLVRCLSSRKLPRLHRRIHALSHADGMEERSVVDSASGLAGGPGPVSLVLLSEEKRALRGPLLKRMMKVRSEIEMVLQAAHTLGAFAEETAQRGVDDGEDAATTMDDDGTEVKKRTWLSSFLATDRKPAPMKKPRHSKFKVIYQNR